MRTDATTSERCLSLAVPLARHSLVYAAQKRLTTLLKHINLRLLLVTLLSCLKALPHSMLKAQSTLSHTRHTCSSGTVFSAAARTSPAGISGRYCPDCCSFSGLIMFCCLAANKAGVVLTKHLLAQPYQAQALSDAECCRRQSLRCMASSAGGTLRREVLNRSQRVKIDPDDDRQFYGVFRQRSISMQVAAFALHTAAIDWVIVWAQIPLLLLA